MNKLIKVTRTRTHSNQDQIDQIVHKLNRIKAIREEHADLCKRADALGISTTSIFANGFADAERSYQNLTAKLGDLYLKGSTNIETKISERQPLQIYGKNLKPGMRVKLSDDGEDALNDTSDNNRKWRSRQGKIKGLGTILWRAIGSVNTSKTETEPSVDLCFYVCFDSGQTIRCYASDIELIKPKSRKQPTSQSLPLKLVG